MRKAAAFVVAIFMSCAAFGANQSREQKRLEACGQVFKKLWTSLMAFRKICSTRPNASL